MIRKAETKGEGVSLLRKFHWVRIRGERQVIRNLVAAELLLYIINTQLFHAYWVDSSENVRNTSPPKKMKHINKKNKNAKNNLYS